MAYTDIDDPSAYFQTATYTGNGGTLAVANTGNSDLQPDFVWVKSRTQGNSHVFFDVVRTFAGDKEIQSNNTGIEGASDSAGYGYVSAVGSDGFTAQAGSTAGDYTNVNSQNYVAWQWKAGTAASGNTSGEGTAKTFSSSSSSTAGFSIVKYVGNGTTNHAIPHGCGTAPKMIIVKTTDKASQAWPVDTRTTTGSGVMYLNETGAAGAYGNDNPFTSVAPTSSVFSVGSPGNTNYNNSTYIAYCFAPIQGYSKVGFYTGNNNADGTFVHTGFKPAFVMVKKQSASGTAWGIVDNKRNNSANPGNLIAAMLNPNTTGTEGGNNELDLLSNGFKWRGTDGNSNAANLYIYVAFAEQPFVTSTGIPATAR